MTDEQTELLKAILEQLKRINENFEQLRKEIRTEFESLSSDVRSIL
jgi:hypothetical protein